MTSHLMIASSIGYGHGADFYLQNIARCLVDAGHEVTVGVKGEIVKRGNDLHGAVKVDRLNDASSALFLASAVDFVWCAADEPSRSLTGASKRTVWLMQNEGAAARNALQQFRRPQDIVLACSQHVSDLVKASAVFLPIPEHCRFGEYGPAKLSFLSPSSAAAKGGHVISVAARKLKDAGADFRWEIGTSPYAASVVDESIAELWVSEEICWRRAMMYGHASETIVIPSLTEGFGIAALEALTCSHDSCTVILSDIPAHREVANLAGRDAVVWVRPNDPEELFDQLLIRRGNQGPQGSPELGKLANTRFAADVLPLLTSSP